MDSFSTNHEIEVQWVTRSYRTVALFALLLATIGGALLYYRYQDWVRDFLWRRITGAVLSAVPYGHKATAASAAHFTGVVGAVRTKSANLKFWVDAAADKTLAVGDLVETSGNSTASITFVDGIAAQLAPDSVIQLNRNATDAGRHTELLLDLTAGSMDLSIGPQNTGSNVRVSMGDTSVLVLSRTRILLRNDPRTREHELTVSEGRAELLRGAEDVSVSANQQVRFRDDSPSLQSVDLPDAPQMRAPEDGSMLVMADKASRARLEWGTVSKVRRYRVRISHDPHFTGEIFQRDVEGTEIQLAGLAAGDYYWTIQSVDAAGHESIPGDPHRFTVSSEQTLALAFDTTVAQQHTIEISGRTEPGARVLVNGRQAVVDDSGSFRYSTSSMPAGVQIISVTAQNAAGAVITKQAAVEVR